MEKLAELSWPGAAVICVLIVCGAVLIFCLIDRWL